MANKEANSLPYNQNRDEKVDKLLVFGYIKTIQLLLNEKAINDKKIFYVIPQSIIDLCFNFYHILEEYDTEFEFSGDDLTYSDDLSIVTTNASCSIFFKRIFNSGQHHWKFKLLEAPTFRVEIGIWKINSGEPKRDWFTSTTQAGYSFSPKYGQLNNMESPTSFGDNYGERCNEKDIIDMYVDMNKLELSYSINGKYYGKAWDIERTKYRAAVCIGTRDKIEFILYDNNLTIENSQK